MPIRRARRRGQALVEFAIVAVVLYIVIGAILTFGRAFFVVQVVQQSTDVLTHELAETPLPPTDNMDPTSPQYAIADFAVQTRIFDTTVAGLQFNYSNAAFQSWANEAAQQQSGRNSLVDYFEAEYAGAQGHPLPIVNQLLIPAMIIESIDPNNSDSLCLTYPGVEWDPGAPMAPYVFRLLNDGSLNGTVDRVPIIEGLDAANDPFPLGAAGTGGIAAVRLNYPFQSAPLSSFTTNDPTTSTFVQATPADAGFNSPQSVQGGLYGGSNHLGVQAVGKLVVRPYQRILSGQAAYRREVFSPPTPPGG